MNKISENDYYVKKIENVYCLVDRKNNERYIIDFFIYDTKNYYTIRLISDIVIIDNEIYINYLNINSGGNSSLLNNGAESDTITPTDGILVIGTTK